MRAWLNHLHLSPYCKERYPGIYDNKGRRACPCGWVDSGEQRCAGCQELKTTVDDTGYCKWCRRRRMLGEV